MLVDLAVRRSTSTHPVPGGTAVLHASFPDAHDHNRLLVTGECDAGDLAAAVDRVLGGAGLGHRVVDVLDAGLGHRLAGELAGQGWTASDQLLMAATGPPSRGEPVEVVQLPLDDRVAAARQDWRRDEPTWGDAVVEQLAQRIVTAPEAADTTFLGVHDGSGVAARADLFVLGGVARVEEVMTRPHARRRGLASALVLHAVALARARGADLVFLVADADDTPQHLYRRLGFTDLGCTVQLTRG